MSHDFWYLSRASGITAYVLLTLAVVMGIVMSSRLAGRLGSKATVFDLHQHASLLAFITSAVHAAALLGDSYYAFSAESLAVPLASPFRPWAVAVGTIGFYALAAVTLSFYLRRRIGYTAWRRLHYLTFGAFLLVTVHGLTAGTDTAARVIYVVSTAGIALLTAYRLLNDLPKSSPAWASRVRIAGGVGAAGAAAVVVLAAGFAPVDLSGGAGSGDRLAITASTQRQARELAAFLDARADADDDDDDEDRFEEIDDDGREGLRERAHDHDDDDGHDDEREGEEDDD
jgi:hypothetical protein